MHEILSSSTPGTALLVTLVFLLAGVVKGVVGLGLPTIAMALLALLMAPAQAAALLIVPSLVTNLWQLRPLATLAPLLRRLAPMQLGVCAGTWLGAWALGAPAGDWATAGLGLALMAYAAWGLAGAQLSIGPAAQRWLGPVIGAATGLVTAATGVFVIPAVPYLQALGLQRDALVQAMGISFTVSTLALAGGLYANGQFSSAVLGGSALLLLPALAGMAAGQHLRRSLSAQRFRQVFLVSLMLLGIHMLAKQLLGP